MNQRYSAGALLVLCVALLTACGSTSQTNRSLTSTSQAKTVEVQITLSDFHITSSLITFAPGVLYHFTVTNTGKTAHELMLMSSTMKTMRMSGMPMSEMDTMALALGIMKRGCTWRSRSERQKHSASQRGEIRTGERFC